MKFSKRWILGLSCVIAVPAYAQSPTDGQQVPEPSAQEATQAAAGAADAPQNANTDGGKSKLRCRLETMTGTRFKNKVCMTEEEWAELRRATKEAMREVDNRPNPTRGPESGPSPPRGY